MDKVARDKGSCGSVCNLESVCVNDACRRRLFDVDYYIGTMLEVTCLKKNHDTHTRAATTTHFGAFCGAMNPQVTASGIQLKLDELARSANGKVDCIPAKLPLVVQAGDERVSLCEGRGRLGPGAPLHRKRQNLGWLLVSIGQDSEKE